MVTAMSFPYIRPRRSPSYRKKGPHRPPPLKLQTTFFKSEQQKAKNKKASIVEPTLKAVRGSDFGLFDLKEGKEETDLPLRKTAVSELEPSGNGEPLLTPTALDKPVEKSNSLKMEDTYTREVSPQASLRLKTHLNDASSDSDISPISDDRPPVRRGSGLRRFFPELSTNVDLISPVSAGKNKKQVARLSILESELEERVQNLCKSPQDEEESDIAEQKTSSSSGSDGIFDCASSCYSRRSSLSSVNEDHLDDMEKCPMSADAYSIISPAAAGVFDDSASVCPSRAASIKSRLQVPTPVKNRVGAHSARGTYSPQCNSVVSINTTTTMNDLKNKPLPLEPTSDADIAPSPLVVGRHNRSNLQQRTTPTSNPHSPYSQSSPSRSHLAVQRSTTTMKSGSPSHGCHSCGGHSARPRKTNRSQWADRLENGKPHIRQLPSLERAAEELEDVLADLQKHGSKQRTLLILDGPLQVSRHNGDLVATRPAPLPPSTKPHSKIHPSPSLDLLRSSKSNKSSKSTKSKKPEKPEKPEKPKRSGKVQRDIRPLNLAAIPESELKKDDKSQNKGHQKSRSLDCQPVSQSTDRSAGPEIEAATKAEEVKKGKPLKKSFTFSMKSFKRSKPARLAGAPLLTSSLSSPSDSSLDPPDEPSCLQSSLSDPTLADEDSGPTKRSDLLLQLPRLQTHDLGLDSVCDRMEVAGQGVAQSTRGNPDASPQERPEKSPQKSPTNSASSKGEPQSQGQERFTPPEEKIVVEPAMKVPEMTRHTYAFVSTAQASSVQLPSDQVYELAATPPSPTSTLPVFGARQLVEANVNFPPDFPLRLTMAIMEKIDSLDDLFNLVLVDKRFYSIFKKHELPLIKNALFKMSPPAWELREMSPPWATETQLLEPDSRVPEYTSSLYLDRYAQDIYTLAKLKAMILVRCSPFLRRDTIRGLSGMDIDRAEEVDDAFWRIWTFCRLFGSNKGRENDLEGQVDWLRGGAKARGYIGASGCMTEPFGLGHALFEPPEGFGRGNGLGLSPRQLYDMTEIWTCMGVLLQPLHGKCIEARRVGIYEGMDVPTDDPALEEQVLEEWTSFVLTIGLSAVLGLSSLAPAEATAAFFNKAQSSGLTKWAPTETETSRSSFLKEAVSRVYEDHERSITDGDGSPMDSSAEIQTQLEREQRHADYKQELRARRARGRELGTGFSEERPMSEFSNIVHNLDGADPNAPPVPALPSLMLDRASTSTSSTAPPPRTPTRSLSPPLPAFDLDVPFHPQSRSPPMQHPPTLFPSPQQHPIPVIPTPLFSQPSLPPQVQDPVDRAIDHMVNDLGFDPDDVKWALKITDTGEGIDVEAAESLLNQQKQKKKKPFGRKESLFRSVMKRQRSTDSGWRFA
ncbi:hypothetical protein N7481_007452 [Penicillium waksmanii]|uniref:uncharacterized protein n=1 Tax=Penicillium waksmanii TaxID=69791 RepID=UPI002547F562|nr:uncharacterized protein N7481_007452 [Penicillium waksmanii]KAJ5980154.1 hypothetical protein N7481_007452 [Penicillium waksmanii]